jgi:outer membrane murein-binding lipoprotein Lpp
MKTVAGMLVGTLVLCGCGITEKVTALSKLDAARSLYKTCMAGHDDDPSLCEAARQTYQAALSEAQQTRGVLTDWRYL